MTWPCSVFWLSPTVSKTWIFALSSATTIYFFVKCKLVTTPWSGVICRASHTPPLRQAVSTIYLCLKCDRYVVAGGRRFTVFLFASRSRLCVLKLSVAPLALPTSSPSFAVASSCLEVRSSLCHHGFGSASSIASPESSSSRMSSFNRARKEYF